jgi:hypothetical protein
MSFLSGRWRVPAAKVKMRSPHFVPLSKQAVAILREIPRSLAPVSSSFRVSAAVLDR